jgi:hypothetical protein
MPIVPDKRKTMPMVPEVTHHYYKMHTTSCMYYLAFILLYRIRIGQVRILDREYSFSVSKNICGE